jgi:hypothetical protein
MIEAAVRYFSTSLLQCRANRPHTRARSFVINRTSVGL